MMCRRKRRDGAAKPVLSDIQTAVDATQKAHLRTKLTRVLNSSKAYPVQFLSEYGVSGPSSNSQVNQSKV